MLNLRPCAPRRTAQGLSDCYAEDEEDGFQGGNPLERLPFSWMARCLVRFEEDPFVLERSDRDKHQACVDKLRTVFRESIELALPGPWWTSPTEAESGGIVFASDMPQPEPMAQEAQEANWLFRHSHEERTERAEGQVGPSNQCISGFGWRERLAFTYTYLLTGMLDRSTCLSYWRKLAGFT